MKPEDCPQWAKCSAALCPLRTARELRRLRGYLVGDDAICQEHPADLLVVQQNRLRQAGARGLFTYAMLLGLAEVPPGLEGLALADSYGRPYRLRAADRRWRANYQTPGVLEAV
jgi:hypothetical protein